MVAAGPPVRPYRVISMGPALLREFPRSRGGAGAGGAAGGLAGWRGAAAGGTASRGPPVGCDAPSWHILNPRLLCPAGTVRAPTCSPREALRFDASVPRAAPVPCRAVPCPGADSWPVCPAAGAAHRQPVGADVLPAVPPRAQGLGGAGPQRAGFPRREAAAGLRANARAEPPGGNAAVDLPELPEERGGGRAAGGAGAGPGGRREQGLGAAEGVLAPTPWDLPPPPKAAASPCVSLARSRCPTHPASRSLVGVAPTPLPLPPPPPPPRATGTQGTGTPALSCLLTSSRGSGTRRTPTGRRRAVPLGPPLLR